MAAKTPIRSKSNTSLFSPSLVKSKSIFLNEWWLVKPQQQCKGLAVGGVASSMERAREFSSAVIAKRHEPNVLETENGITIFFRGFINTARTSQNGFPSEVCQHFLLGFPHDWEKYSAHSEGDEHINGVTGFDDSNASVNKAADETLSFSVSDTGDVPPPKKFCSGLGIYSGNSSKQSESTGNMKCGIHMENGINMMSMEAENKDNMGNSQPQVAVICNDKNGVSYVATVESGQSLMGVFDQSLRASVASPISTEKSENGRLYGYHKKKQHKREKIAEDTNKSCSRRVTRSVSKRSNLSNASSHRTVVVGVMAFPFSLPNNNEVFPPKEICNGVENSSGNCSEQSKSTDHMECGIGMMTMEAAGKDHMGNLQLSQQWGEMIYNGENGVSNVAAVNSGQPLMGVSSEGKKKQFIQKKIVEDAGNSSNRVLKKSISKRNTMVKEDGKVKAVRVSSSPVRRSPRLFKK